MILFFYGTLLDPATLAATSGDPGLPARCQDAVLCGWRRVTLEWDDGWWYLDFDAKREASRKRWHPNR